MKIRCILESALLEKQSANLIAEGNPNLILRGRFEEGAWRLEFRLQIIVSRF